MKVEPSLASLLPPNYLAIQSSCLSSCHSSLISSSPLLEVTTMDSTIELPRNLFLLASPLLRSLLPSSSSCSSLSSSLVLPSCRTSHLLLLSSLLQHGVSSPTSLTTILPATQAMVEVAQLLHITGLRVDTLTPEPRGQATQGSPQHTQAFPPSSVS